MGPRKKGHMQQATVAEGPNEPKIGREHQFCFHRKKTGLGTTYRIKNY